MKETRFKDTELGMIPEDWENGKFQDFLATFSSGATPYRGIQEYFEGDVRWISSGELNYNIITETLEHISQEAVVRTNLKIHQPGTFLMAITGLEAAGTRGRCAIVGKPSTTNQSCLALNSTDKMGTDYLYWFYNFWSETLAFKYAQGTKQQSFTANIVRKLPIYCPKDKSEQTRIATALSNVDALISELGKLIEKKRAIKQGAMQQLITGKKRLKGFSEPWKKVRLGDFGRFVSGNCFPLQYQGEQQGELPFYKVSDFNNNNDDRYLHEANNYISHDTSNILHCNIIPQNSIVFAKIGAAIFLERKRLTSKQCCIDNNMMSFQLSDRYDSDFLLYVLKTINLGDLVNATALPALKTKDLQELGILLPPSLVEQHAISHILSGMDNEIITLETKRDKYAVIKQGMMQQLLTGRIRLVETTVKTNTTSANVHFRRSVLAAEIADRLCEEPTFGHVKMEKMLFLTERLCHIDIGSHYHRDAAGPYDNRALRSIDSQLKKQKWFEVRQIEKKGNRYVPMQNRGKHKTYFDKYYSDVLPTFEKIIDTFKTQNTERCEIVATLYSAWEDLLHNNKPFTDTDIVNEVLNNWHESKKRISQDRWLNAIQWMRENGFAPNV